MCLGFGRRPSIYIFTDLPCPPHFECPAASGTFWQLANRMYRCFGMALMAQTLQARLVWWRGATCPPLNRGLWPAKKCLTQLHQHLPDATYVFQTDLRSTCPASPPTTAPVCSGTGCFACWTAAGASQ